MASETGLLVLAGTVSSGFFIFSLTRAARMRDDKRPVAELLWYSGGLIPLAAVCLIWASMGNQPVTAQRIILFVLGAAIGGFGLIGAGEYLRPPAQCSADSDAGSTRSAFSETQSIKTLPLDLGGNETLRLDNIATMSLAEHTLASATLTLDAVQLGLDLKVPKGFPFEIKDPKFTIGGQRFTFDIGKNKRHEVKTSGRCFVVTLFEIKPLDVPGLTNPREFIFGISEK
jgi:hypothetical protein